MAAGPSSSSLLASPRPQIERAWHLLTVLIRLGRPACPAELASRCVLTPAPSPDHVELLCQIPGSPLLLIDGHLVTVSNLAFAALAGFVSDAISPFVPRFAIRAVGQKRVWADLSLIYVRKRKARPSEDALVLPRAKRSLLLDSDRYVDNSRKNDRRQLCTSDWNYSAPTMVLSVDDVLAALGNTSDILNPESSFLPSLHNSCAVLSNFGNIGHAGGTIETEKVCDDTQAIVAYMELPELSSYRHGSFDVEIDPALVYEPVLQNEARRGERDPKMATSLAEVISTVPFGLEFNQELNAPSAETCTLDAIATEYQKQETSLNNHTSMRNFEKSALADQTASKLKTPAEPFAAEQPEPTIVRKEQRKSFEKLKTMQGRASTVGLQGSNDIVNNRRDADSPKSEQAKRSEKCTSVKQKMKRSHTHNMHTKGNRVDIIPKATKSHLEPKLLPNFESFTIEEEEGSGGYGTVYRARRKEDEKIFAIKCPHANAHTHHINNELRMLERFGGRNFVIKYEGSFRSGDSECFVLEHVEHDRPENLKKEIDIFGLQWYGYCMFRALASLHKQGIVHRDVKPGNFLFSRKLNKGYLIDFNLANDLHQKFCRSSKSKIGSNVIIDPISLPIVKSSSYTEARKEINGGTLDRARKEVANMLKKPLLSKNMKKRSGNGYLDTFPNIDSRNKCASQAADVSGVTSAKDPTSTRTHSRDKLKQPILCKGRKELINFVQEAMQNPNHKVVTVPVPRRKRIAAPLGRVDRGLFVLTPMPLHSRGNAVAGAGMLRNRGNGKLKREGPCVGTKGFRAPEVLLRSNHQGCKIDIWSAGVTLLYLIIGRTPFGGDPELNIKEIAKLRGSEDLWEVAKLHDCEPSFPADLFDVQSLRSMELQDWCVANTRRPEFIGLIPRSLFDLLDKCLMVNPRCRITAEGALMHEFFAPCHESLKKQRVLRRAAGSEPGNHPPP